MLSWRIERISDAAEALPKVLLTRKPFDANGQLDLATALLLPSAGVPRQAITDELTQTDHLPHEICVGVWMGSCFPVSPRSQRVKPTFEWVSNFPSTSIYEDSFTESLEEVQLGPGREFAQLAAFKAQGHKVMLTLNPVQSVAEEALQETDALLIALRSASDLERLREGRLGELRAQMKPVTPIILHGGDGGHLPNAPASLGVQAILQLPT